MTYYDYTHPNNWMLIVALSLFILAIILFEFVDKKPYSLIALFLGSISIFSYMALAFPFLHVWDEQFHALVAKNLRNHFFYPTLLENPILAYGRSWVDTHLWLHKQPFFLWQMALSMKIFGVNTFALRLPDILMASSMTLLIYRIGKILQSKSLGFYAALLFLTSNFLYQLIPATLNTDHNDMAFIFYISASFWAWFEYRNSGNKLWLIAIGLFSGIAILVKWLVGLIVYAGWGISILAQANKRFKIESYYDLLKSFVITLFVALPWQLYILIRFPEVSKYEYALNSLHLYKEVEGHGGAWNYHFEQWSTHISNHFEYLIPIAFIVFLFLKIKKEYKIVILSWIFIVSLFFSIAITKMPAFTFILSGLFFILITAPFTQLFQKLLSSRKQAKYVLIFARMGFFAFIFYLMLNVNLIENKPTWKRHLWIKSYREMLCFKAIGEMNLPVNSRFYNFYFHGAVRFMFHTNFQGRSFLPNEKQITILKNKGVPIYVFDNGELPNYILNDTSITKIKSSIWHKKQIEDLEFYQ